ncbi:class I SAM-dependent methyltransferase [Methylorubrum podarium]|uniref:class I SAM-dependent methyltransferase n=1 Tax=Methylorubrum podarium TaxID=200476 RepID=UPI001EE3664E|nr:class I SAM-dependent methyltransferase [Methylorubrum podarium]MDV2985533.1 class I SAM-dependent methyltransferase [Methylobacteriaceae bacterium AG10]GJE73058.1 hypothetical protein CHKEEEPN_4620 [Methylorubrum podarium]
MFGLKKRRRGPPAGSGLLCSGAPAQPPASWEEIVCGYGASVDPAEARAQAGNAAEAAFFAQDDRLATKWHHYLEIYDRHLSRYRGKPVRLLELGVFQGGSLQMWRRYLGPQAVIHGLDINPGCREITEDGLKVHLGSQADPGLLRRIAEEMGGIDVVIDDAGHISAEQIASFEVLYPLLAPDGVYIVEDVHASYWPDHGGGLRAHGAFMEYAKLLLDRLHARYVLDPDPFARDPGFADVTHGIGFHDSMVVFEKRLKPLPRSLRVGHRTLS